MKALLVGLALAWSSLSLSGCGTASGAVVGGVAGHAIGGDTASTVGGAVAGGIIGHELNK
jgi:osmotically inducible lipoprotein OsmB